MLDNPVHDNSSFTVSPGFDVGVVRASHDVGIPALACLLRAASGASG
ncbi:MULTISPECIES: hypothetical protein [Microbacterium]|uniref:Uncharacterized protein n=1 Tax=Microbacterium profundi TaxID=450380 RepID=A0ABV3LEC1_9MICO|nr:MULTISPECIES: hypothetical protein [Microbacterium]MCE7482898.1 hypothetical protein [Microbacterium profundi]